MVFFSFLDVRMRYLPRPRLGEQDTDDVEVAVVGSNVEGGPTANDKLNQLVVLAPIITEQMPKKMRMNLYRTLLNILGSAPRSRRYCTTLS